MRERDLAKGHAPLATQGYLLVEDDPAVARQVRTVFEEQAPVRHASTLAEARSITVARPRWLGVIMDVRLPDGDGLDLLEELRDSGFVGAALIVTGWPRTEILHRAQRLNAFMLPKPAPVEGLRSFLRWTLIDRDRNRRLAAVVEEAAVGWGLTRRERHVLDLAVAGVARGQLAAELGLAENTVKTHVRRLLRKGCAETLGDLVAGIYRDAHRPRGQGADPREGLDDAVDLE